MITKIFNVEEKHCTSCEDLNEGTKETKGTLSTEENYTTNKIMVSFDEQIVNEVYKWLSRKALNSK